METNVKRTQHSFFKFKESSTCRLFIIKKRHISKEVICILQNKSKDRYFCIDAQAGIRTEVQSTLVISKSKGPFETLRAIRTSTYQICRI